MEDKRRVFPRVDVSITIKQAGNAVNISEGGLCIISDSPLPIGQVVELDLLLSKSNEEAEKASSGTVKREGIVLWSKYSEIFDKHEMGVKFTDSYTSDREKIKSFIESHI